MKKNLITILLILFVPIVGYLALTKSMATTNQYEAAAETVGKPQVIKFTSTMCLDCQKMNKIFQDIFPKYEDKIVMTEVHIQDGSSFNDEQIQKYNVTLVPTIILIDSQGKQVRRIEGAIEQSEMEKCLEALK